MPPNRPQRKQLAPRDMMIVALAILVITRIDFANFNSFHVLILFLLFLMLMLRWGNMRKEAVRKNALERYKDQFETEAVKKSVFQWADEPAENASAAEMTVAHDTADEPAAVAETAPAEDKPVE